MDGAQRLDASDWRGLRDRLRRCQQANGHGGAGYWRLLPERTQWTNVQTPHGRRRPQCRGERQNPFRPQRHLHQRPESLSADTLDGQRKRHNRSHKRCSTPKTSISNPSDFTDCSTKGAVLPRQHIEYPAGHWRNPVIFGIGNDLKQSAGSTAALRRHDAEFGQMPAYGVAQHRALTHQQLSGPVQQQGGLLLLRLDRNKPHRWPRHRLKLHRSPLHRSHHSCCA